MCTNIQKLMCKQNLKKVCLPTLCGPQTRQMFPFYVFVILIIRGYCLFSHLLAKLANIRQGKKVGKHSPPKIWGDYTFFFF